MQQTAPMQKTTAINFSEVCANLDAVKNTPVARGIQRYVAIYNATINPEPTSENTTIDAITDTTIDTISR